MSHRLHAGLLLLILACGSGDRVGGQDVTGGGSDGYDSSVCPEIDPAPYAAILGVPVPRLEVTTDAPLLFRCRARTEELLVTVQFRSDLDYWEGFPDRLGAPLDLEPLEAWAGTETSGNLLVVRLERPWSAVVFAATQERPDPTSEQLEAVLRGLADLRR